MIVTYVRTRVDTQVPLYIVVEDVYLMFRVTQQFIGEQAGVFCLVIFDVAVTFCFLIVD